MKTTLTNIALFLAFFGVITGVISGLEYVGYNFVGLFDRLGDWGYILLQAIVLVPVILLDKKYGCALMAYACLFTLLFLTAFSADELFKANSSLIGMLLCAGIKIYYSFSQRLNLGEEQP